MVAAIACSCFSLMESTIDLEAPGSEFLLVSLRLAESAAPAAFCCAFDLAGMQRAPSTRIARQPKAAVCASNAKRSRMFRRMADFKRRASLTAGAPAIG